MGCSPSGDERHQDSSIIPSQPGMNSGDPNVLQHPGTTTLPGERASIQLTPVMLLTPQGTRASPLQTPWELILPRIQGGQMGFKCECA